MAVNIQSSQPSYLSSIWLILGLIILIGNISASISVWFAKANRRKSCPLLKCHSAWNILGIDAAFSTFGLTLTIISVVRLASDGEIISEAACDVLGFFQTFTYNFAALGVFVVQADRLYGYIKPFDYHVYSKDESKVPLILFICCTVYGGLIASLPLTKMGNYSTQTAYTSCLLTWNENSAVRVALSLNIVLLLGTVVVTSANFRQKLTRNRKRREMKVAVTRSGGDSDIRTDNFISVYRLLVSNCGKA